MFVRYRFTAVSPYLDTRHVRYLILLLNQTNHQRAPVQWAGLLGPADRGCLQLGWQWAYTSSGPSSAAHVVPVPECWIYYRYITILLLNSLYVLQFSRRPLIRSASHLAGVAQNPSAVLSVTLEMAARSNTGGQAIGLFPTSTLQIGF